MSEIRMFSRKDGQAERMLGVLAFMQAQRLTGRVLMIYDTRSRSMCAAVRYESDMPVALLGFLAGEIGPVEYVQADRRFQVRRPGAFQGSGRLAGRLPEAGIGRPKTGKLSASALRDFSRGLYDRCLRKEISFLGPLIFTEKCGKMWMFTTDGRKGFFIFSLLSEYAGQVMRPSGVFLYAEKFHGALHLSGLRVIIGS